MEKAMKNHTYRHAIGHDEKQVKRAQIWVPWKGHYGQVRTGPKSQVPSHLRSIHAILAIESMEVGTYHFTQGSKYDMDAHMTLFGGEAWEMCWELGLAKS